MKRSFAIIAGLALAVATPGLAAANPTSPVTGQQAISLVVQRALSQQGVPYVYGGGDVSGPTNGIRAGSTATTPSTSGFPGTTGTTTGTTPGTSGFTGTTPGTGSTVGFDSSGLIQYAFAGAGIKMPRTSGEQCSVGRKVLPAQARAGDLLCYGPGGSQSVALYLGNGQMIEGTEPVVTVSAARTTNMVTYLTRIIES